MNTVEKIGLVVGLYACGAVAFGVKQYPRIRRERRMTGNPFHDLQRKGAWDSVEKRGQKATADLRPGTF